MDSTGIDRLIEVLEKAATSELQKFDSPPTVVAGRRGIWRTVRGFRMFIEIDGPISISGDHIPNGRILFGPPSLKGKNSGEIGGDAWAALTPKATNQKFSNVDVANGGLDNLKSQIKATLGPDDTRNKALEGMNSVEQMVPLARSAGFLDNEISSALKGDKVVPGEVHEMPTKNRLRGTQAPEAPKVEAPAKPQDEMPELAATGTDAPAALRPRPTRDTKPKSSDSSAAPTSLVHGALALARGADSASNNEDDAKRQEFAGKLREAAAHADTAGEAKLAGLYREFANLIIPDREQQNKGALERVGRQILDFRNEARANAASAPETKPAPHVPNAPSVPKAPEVASTDKELVQNAVDNAVKQVETTYQKYLVEAKNDIEKAKDLALGEILSQIGQNAKSTQVKVQIRRAVNDLKSGKRNRRYTMLRLVRILRILMAVVPG